MSQEQKGVLSVFATYTVWGLQPLYWKWLSHIDIETVMAARIIWSFVLCALVLAYRRKGASTGKPRSRREWVILFLAAYMLGGNWALNIYAAVSDKVIEASLGHFITPVLTIFAGLLFFGERMNVYEKIGLAFALAGAGYILAREGRLPMVAVLIILTFLAYTILKKQAASNALEGFVTETLLLLPAAVWVIFNKVGNWEALLTLRNMLLLFSTGIFTAVPMLLFAYGVKRIRLASMGYIQYYAPTVSFLLGVYWFREPLDRIRLTGFVLIWIGAFAATVWPQVKKLLKNYQIMRYSA